MIKIRPNQTELEKGPSLKDASTPERPSEKTQGGGEPERPHVPSWGGAV